ncbi:MAG: hypothetical protein ABR538_09410 [Candidatus Binatia bacterium]
MDDFRKVVLVASGSSADRAIALERLLSAAADRSGWSGRLEIRLGGVDGGAGRLSDAGHSALEEAGIDAAGVVCPDLGRRPNLLEGASIVVCDRGDVADVLVDWDEAGEAQFVCVDEIDPQAAETDEDTADLPIADEVGVYQGKIDEVLRRIVSEAAVD